MYFNYNRKAPILHLENAPVSASDKIPLYFVRNNCLGMTMTNHSPIITILPTSIAANRYYFNLPSKIHQ